MPLNFASAVLLTAIVAAILPPGYFAYIGAYLALSASGLAFVVFGWSERNAFAHPSSMAILCALALVTATVPIVYQGEKDILAPILLLPVLSAVAMGLLARRANWVPNPTVFASICLSASAIALLGGAYQQLVLGAYRPGLGNNPIHYSSLAVMSGCLALVGVVGGSTRWRYFFLLGPMLGIGAAAISDSRGPMAGALAMTSVGILVLLTWLWSERPFRLAVLATIAAGAGTVIYILSNSNMRVAGILEGSLNMFRFTGGTDDIRAALYASALHALGTSPVVGIGLGQIMLTAQTLFPSRPEMFWLENLHADWANFAVMAGGLGLMAWLLLLAAPLLILLDSKARQDQPVVLGSILLTTGQLVLGISNATFGILPQTAIYAVALGYLLVRARRLALTDVSSE